LPHVFCLVDDLYRALVRRPREVLGHTVAVWINLSLVAGRSTSTAWRPEKHAHSVK